MKTIWSKLLDIIKNNKLTFIIIALIFVLLTIVYFQHQRIQNWKEKYNDEVNLNDALGDTITRYQNKHNEWVAEKQAIQTTVENLEKQNNILTDNQKELLLRIKEAEKNNSIIAAALVETNVKIDSLLAKDGENGNVVTVDTTQKIVNINNFNANDSSFVYDIDVLNVLPAFSTIKPSMLFKSIEIPNKQYIDFYWENDRKKGYPVKFSISNSNKYVKTIGLDSYIIPNINKKYLDPNGWQKIGNFIYKNGSVIVYVGIGAAVGAGAFYLLTR